MTAPARTRKTDLDFLRVAAILAVIVIHCIAAVVTQREAGTGAQVIGNVIDSFSRWCVPVFLMISGALVIKPMTFADGEMLPYLKKRMSRITIPLLLWPLLYALWAALVLHTPLEPWTLVKEYLVGSPSIGFHLYFLFAIAGLYVLLPLINVCVSRLTRRQLWYATIAIMVATAIWWGMGYISPAYSGSLNIISRGLPFLGYFLLGYLMRDMRPRQPLVPVAFFILGSSLIAALTYITLQYDSVYFYDYPSVTVMFVSPMAFLAGRYAYEKLASLFSKRRREGFDKALVVLSAASFGVYLVHVLVLKSLLAWFHLDTKSLKVSLVLMPVIAVLSWALTLLMMRVPYLNRLVR